MGALTMKRTFAKAQQKRIRELEQDLESLMSDDS